MKTPNNEEPSFMLPVDAAERKKFPIYTGCVAYFKDALACVARRSWEGNNQHHPDEPLHWDKSKSYDELDADMRHKIENEPDAAAWRALAHLQRQLEAGWRPTWYNPEHYVHNQSLGMQQIDLEENDTDKTEEILCRTTGEHFATWGYNPLGFFIEDKGFELWLKEQGWGFSHEVREVFYWSTHDEEGVNCLQKLRAQYLADPDKHDIESTRSTD